MYYWEEELADESYEEYQKSVRVRANESLDELRQSLSGNKSAAEASPSKNRLSDSVHPRHLAYSDRESYGLYRDATQQLRRLLDRGNIHKPEDPPSASLLREHGERMSDLPSAEEAVTILQRQTGYLQQLETENRYIKEELTAVRLKMNELVEENRQLHEELKTSVLQEIIGTGGRHVGQGSSSIQTEVFEAVAGRADLKKWKADMGRLSSLHEAKTKRLESQLASAKLEIDRYEKSVEELRAQLRMQDTSVQIATKEDGTSGNFMYSDTQTAIHLRTIERLTKERDDLVKHMSSMKSKLEDMTYREEEAYLQIKRGIELVEQAQLEQTEAVVQKEQLVDELENMKERFNQLLTDSQRKMDEEREVVRKENKHLVDELNTKMKELTEVHMSTHNQLERELRERSALSTELDETKIQLRKYDKEVTVATETYRSENTNATIQRQQAAHEVTRLRTDLQQCEKERDQERSKYRAEVEDLRRRLHKAEREVVNAKEECIHFTSNTQALERELHLAKMARDSVEKGRNDDLKALTRRAQQREQELGTFIDEVESKHAKTEAEMDQMLKKQNQLIGKLRDECRRQANQLEKISKNNRSEVGGLRKDSENMRMRLERATSRLKDLEEQNDQHARLHEKMRQRLKMMDDHAQHQAQQILDLLSKQSGFMKDRQLLAREVEFLRSKLLPSNESDIDKLFTSRKGAVDEVLSTMTLEKGDRDIWKDMIQPPKLLGMDELSSS